jgi:hypothetical protein
MKDHERDIIINFSSMGVVHYARIVLSKAKKTWKQNLALFLLNVVAVVIVHLTPFDELYKLTLIAIIGLILPNIVSGVMKGGEKSEESISHGVEKTINKIID